MIVEVQPEECVAGEDDVEQVNRLSGNTQSLTIRTQSLTPPSRRVGRLRSQMSEVKKCMLCVVQFSGHTTRRRDGD